MAHIRVIPARDEANIEQKLVTLLLAAVQEKPDLIISVFAGTPAFGAYRLLVERARAEVVDFSRVRFVVFDELSSPGKRSEIGGRSTPRNTAGGRHLPLPRRAGRAALHPPGDPAENVISFSPARDRAAETARVAGHLAVAGIDIALLSVDSRGHIGFHVTGSRPRLEGGHRPGGKQRTLEGGRGVFPRSCRPRPGVAHPAIRRGPQPRGDRARLTEGTFDPSVPISVLQRHGNVLLVADSGALSLIAREERIHGFYSGFFIMDAKSAPSGRRVLVVSPHPDDAPISLGGTMAMLSQANTVATAVMTTGHRSFIYGTQRAERIAIREAEVVKESRFLGAEPRFLRLPFYDSKLRGVGARPGDLRKPPGRAQA